MKKINFEDGKKIKDAVVVIDNQEHAVIPAQIEGTTPLSAFNLNNMQNNIETEINSVIADLFYKDGEIFENNSALIEGGFLTGASKNVNFQIVLPKQLSKDINRVTVNTLQIIARNNGSYIVGSASKSEDITNEVVAAISTDNTIRFSYTANSSLGGLNNNAIGVIINKVKLTFNK